MTINIWMAILVSIPFLFAIASLPLMFHLAVSSGNQTSISLLLWVIYYQVSAMLLFYTWLKAVGETLSLFNSLI